MSSAPLEFPAAVLFLSLREKNSVFVLFIYRLENFLVALLLKGLCHEGFCQLCSLLCSPSGEENAVLWRNQVQISHSKMLK